MGNNPGARFIRWGGENSAEAEIRRALPEVYPRLWRFCLVLAGRRDAAEDLAQATCLRAIEKSAGYTPGTHVDRWLFVMARRIWLNELRAGTVRRGAGLVPVEDAEIAEEKPSTETNILAREVLSAMGALPEAQRETAHLVYVEGYAYREAAEMLDIPIGTVMSRLAAARRSLNERLGPKETSA
ncbi:RNA polymerase sigma-54 factor RpoN [Candidatus Rhodobacter oscarellae]|uniref:RNA polymerase sigma-54 factor RpoN n=1 Tax=Candidatus Rhodobacter oscarellae TaxID=1675527 RepID=A0A0J9E8V9_9RHOB|nr:RNA polymerase sigma factor [Candidatus Rhodobacter lobularis]KMW59086.1 RNA polymerase sigma-54 factor RpoN [Candidatus Rhodobacter lobularis]